MIVSSELNRKDATPFSGTVQNQAAGLNFVLLSGTTEGDSSASRAGLSARCLRIQGRIFGTRILDTVNATAIRLILIRWKQIENGAVPIQSDLFELANTASYLKWSARGKYQVIMDTVIQLGRTDSGSSAYHLEYNYKVPVKHQLLTYVGSGNGVADAEKNHYFALAYASDGTDVGITWQSRMIFSP